MLIGLGTIIGVSGLVWVGTSQHNATMSQESVEAQPELAIEKQSPKLDEASSAIAHAQDPSNGHVSENRTGGEVEAGVADHTVADSHDEALPTEGVGGHAVADPHGDALPREGSASLKHVRPVKLPQEPIVVAFNAPDKPRPELPEDVLVPKEIAAVKPEETHIDTTLTNELNEPDTGDPLLEEIQALVEEPLIESSLSDDEVLTIEPIAPPIQQEPLSEQSPDYVINDSIDVLAEVEPVNPEPQMIAKNDLSADTQDPQARSSAQDDGAYRLEEIGIRGGFNMEYIAIPPTEKEDFEQFDVFGAISLPKHYSYDSGWEIRFRMNGSLGVLRGDGDLGFIGTVSPGIVFWYPDWNISINGGPGFAYVSREKYGEQDLGGPIQIVGQGGLTYYVTEHVGIGWRFHHISDAGIWGSDNRGVDVNLFELSYKF